MTTAQQTRQRLGYSRKHRASENETGSEASGSGVRSAAASPAPRSGPRYAAFSSDKLTSPTILMVFIVSLGLPFYFFIGDTLLNPHRLFLLLAVVPVAWALLNGKAGKLITADFMVVAYILWSLISILANQGFVSSSFTIWLGQFMLETGMPYFLARVLIRTKADFIFFCRWLLRILLVLLPFTFIESVLHKPILAQLFHYIPGIVVYDNVEYPQRLGLTRAQSVFDHPILFGVFASVAVAMAVRGLRAAGETAFKRSFWLGICLVNLFLSLSAGALAAALLQGGLIVWDHILRNYKARWRLLIGSVLFVYLVLSLMLSSNPLTYIIANATFSAETAWARVNIFEFGSAEVQRHPLLGMGNFTDWQRPFWLPESIDNYWLFTAMRFGYPGLILNALSSLLILRLCWRLDFSARPDLADVRNTYVFTIVALSLALGTVHIWGEVFVLYNFIIGMGAFLRNEHNAMDLSISDTAQPLKGQRPSRLASRASRPLAKG